jgi:hypothetical protein
LRRGVSFVILLFHSHSYSSWSSWALASFSREQMLFPPSVRPFSWVRGQLLTRSNVLGNLFHSGQGKRTEEDVLYLVRRV